MRFIGRLDSPFVRRAAISLFCGFGVFRQFAPVVKASTPTCDDGVQPQAA